MSFDWRLNQLIFVCVHFRQEVNILPITGVRFNFCRMHFIHTFFAPIVIMTFGFIKFDRISIKTWSNKAFFVSKSCVLCFTCVCSQPVDTRAFCSLLVCFHCPLLLSVSILTDHRLNTTRSFDPVLSGSYLFCIWFNTQIKRQCSLN